MKAATWARVSTEGQDTANQTAVLKAEAKRRGLDLVRAWEFDGSAWKGDYRPELQELYDAAGRREFEILLIWSLDRLTREGPLQTLQVIHRLGRYGVTVVSHQEPWLEASGELRDLLLALVGWVARWESQRRSERIKAGMARRRAEGATVGRPAGAKDLHKRRRGGYFRRYEKPR